MSDELLADAEHRAMALTVELWNLLCREIVGHGPSRDGDLCELAHDLHVIQERILAQAAGRAYPDRYRLLGGAVKNEGNAMPAVPYRRAVEQLPRAIPWFPGVSCTHPTPIDITQLGSPFAQTLCGDCGAEWATRR